ncbi:DsbA family protein [Patescibacteria group bacterium]|nr:DsbA family protein [Patescibacteria group bacterium]
MSKSPFFVGTITLVALLLLLIFGLAAVGPILKNKEVDGTEVPGLAKSQTPSADFGNPSLGPAEAELVIFLYGDYQCAACTTFEQILQTIINEYPNQIRLVWKDLPNQRLHPEAWGAALAARCAREQGAFWEYHDTLMNNQAALNEANYPIFAQELGLDTESFETCRQERRTEPLVKRDVEEAINLGVSATPYLFIGDKKFSGSLS